MDLQKMINFITVYECGSISKAAEQLFCTQPALSKQITSLENELGYPLFDRVGKKLFINENAVTFYRFARTVINDYTLLKRELYLKNNEQEHEVRFGTTNFIGTFLLPSILAKFKNEFPTTPTNFVIDFLPQILELLDKDVIHFAIVPGDKKLYDKKDLVCDAFMEDEFVLIFPPDHPLSQKDEIYAKDILEYPFLISQEQSATRSFVTDSLKEHNIELTNTIDMNNIYTIREGILNGLGISIFSKNAIKNDLSYGLLKCATIKDMPMVRHLYFVYKAKHTFVHDEARFMKKFIKNSIDNI